MYCCSTLYIGIAALQVEQGVKGSHGEVGLPGLRGLSGNRVRYIIYNGNRQTHSNGSQCIGTPVDL